MKTESQQLLKLYPNVIPVKGYNRSLLVDLQKGTPYLVPNDLVDYLEQVPETVVEEYEQFLIENELGIKIDEEFGACLTPFPTDYYPTSQITNAILELDAHSSWNLPSVLDQLDRLGTQFLEVRFLDETSLVKYLRILREHTHTTTIEFIQILVPYSNGLKSFLDAILSERFSRLSTIVVYNASEGFELNELYYNLVFTRQESVSREHCGNISPDSFTINTLAYARNRNYNSCLAHKISIDKDGLICNCPSADTPYGHSDSVALSEVVKTAEFRSKWEVTKDQLLVCGVCEFRWICTDCRVYTVDGLENGKPAKCGYNPYISKWNHEEGYLPEQDCGVSFQDGKLHVDEAKVNQLNAQLWG